MSDVETPVEGAAPLPETPATPAEQVTPQASAPVEPEAQPEQPRDENGRFQKRVNELTRKTWDARREADQYRQRLEQVEAELSRYRQPQAPDPNENPVEYVRHLAREEARQLVESERSQAQQTQEQQRWQSLAQEHEAREREYAARNPGYMEAMDAFAAVVGVNPPLAEVLMTSEHGPAVVEYLGNHLDEAARISQLPPHLAAREVTRIESRVSAPKPKPTTNAPAPVPTLGGSAIVSKDLSTMSYEDYKRERMKG